MFSKFILVQHFFSSYGQIMFHSSLIYHLLIGSLFWLWWILLLCMLSIHATEDKKTWHLLVSTDVLKYKFLPELPKLRILRCMSEFFFMLELVWIGFLSTWKNPDYHKISNCGLWNQRKKNFLIKNTFLTQDQEKFSEVQSSPVPKQSWNKNLKHFWATRMSSAMQHTFLNCVYCHRGIS